MSKVSSLNGTGRLFNFDRHIFNILLCLTLFFIICYVAGTSVPAWFVIHERIANLSTCDSADYYVGSEERLDWSPEPTELELYASLWFVRLRLHSSRDEFQTYLPYTNIPFAGHSGRGERQDAVSEWIFSGSYISFMIVALLVACLVFTYRASFRPSRIIYYGLSSVSVVTAISLWVSTAIHSSQRHVISLMSDLCLQDGAISTSIYLQVATGSAAILSFIFGCVLIHIATVINTKIGATQDFDDAFDISEKTLDEREIIPLYIHKIMKSKT